MDDIKAIRKIMEDNSRFLSLSGLSGVIAGAIAIVGALIAYYAILDKGSFGLGDYLGNIFGRGGSETLRLLLLDAALVLVASVSVALYFSAKKAGKEGKSLFSPISRRLLINLLIPLVAGGLFIAVLLINNNLQLVIPCFLIFYGLALVNAGKFTLGEIFYLGILEIIIGLVCAFVPGWGLLFWIIGFGLLHIIYGVAMHRKYGA